MHAVTVTKGRNKSAREEPGVLGALHLGELRLALIEGFAESLLEGAILLDEAADPEQEAQVVLLDGLRLEDLGEVPRGELVEHLHGRGQVRRSANVRELDRSGTEERELLVSHRGEQGQTSSRLDHF